MLDSSIPNDIKNSVIKHFGVVLPRHAAKLTNEYYDMAPVTRLNQKREPKDH